MSKYYRRDFRIVADVLRRNKPAIPEREYEWLVFDMARSLADTNPQFNRERFFKACGIDIELKVLRYGKRDGSR